ncbi:MAG TPA: SRPBCC domain-containing protein [Nitrososphaeraceae archaeon]|jgi:ligand-binding SRPBCC domain-containing protein|nr:SRPBCC domain-containing protein [Nitrososphaeraceae archaeon]
MTEIKYEININAPVERVFEYYTNPDNIKKAWPQDIVKESESISESKNEEGSEMKVKGEYMGREEEMTLEVIEKEQNKRLVTEQKEGPFKQWKSIQLFEQGNNGNNTNVRHEIEYELPTTGKIANFLSGDQANSKIQQGLQQAAQTVKQKLESA